MPMGWFEDDGLTILFRLRVVCPCVFKMCDIFVDSNGLLLVSASGRGSRLFLRIVLYCVFSLCCFLLMLRTKLRCTFDLVSSFRLLKK